MNRDCKDSIVAASRLIGVNTCLVSAESLTASQLARWQLHRTQSNDGHSMLPQTRSISLTWWLQMLLCNAMVLWSVSVAGP